MQEVIDKGGLDYFVKFTYSSDPHLRLHSVWALKNLLYKASTASKVVVIRQLTYSHLVDLLNDPEPLIEEQAVSLVGNLVYGGEEVCVLPSLDPSYKLVAERKYI